MTPTRQGAAGGSVNRRRLHAVRDELQRRHPGLDVSVCGSNRWGFLAGAPPSRLHDDYGRFAEAVCDVLGLPQRKHFCLGSTLATYWSQAPNQAPHIAGEGTSDLDFTLEVLHALGVEIEVQPEPTRSRQGPGLLLKLSAKQPFPALTTQSVECAARCVERQIASLAKGDPGLSDPLLLYMHGGTPYGWCQRLADGAVGLRDWPPVILGGFPLGQ